MEMDHLWTVFCGGPNCSRSHESSCKDLIYVTHPSSCINHALIVCFDLVLLVMLLFTIMSKKSSKSLQISASSRNISRLQIVSAIINGLLGLVCLSFGVCILEERLRENRAFVSVHWWTLFVFHGLSWLFLGLTLSLWGHRFSRSHVRLNSILAFLVTGITCGLSLFAVILEKKVSIKMVLDVLYFIGSIFLLLCTYKGFRYEDSDKNSIYDPLLDSADGGSKTCSDSHVTGFAKASFLSNEDVPKLCEDDRVESCYLLYTEILNEKGLSVLKTILLCHWKEILIS